MKNALHDVFTSFGITKQQLDQAVFTTDRGSNMIVALKEEERLDCIAHVLNTVLRHTFDEKKDCPLSVTKMISACKSLVRYVKKSSFQKLLSKGVSQSCDTRWNSIYTMLDSVKTAYDDIYKLIQEHAPSEVRRLSSIDRELLNEIKTFLEVNDCKFLLVFH